MKTARTWAVALAGVDGRLVEVEADVSSQIPELRIIGLADKALGEAVQRVRNACENSGLELPRRRVTVNLSPASLPKQGSGFDLAIAISALAAGGVIDPSRIASTAHIGELALDGRLRPVVGVLPMVHAAVRAGIPRVVVPAANRAEAELVPGIEVIPSSSLAEVARWYGADAVVPDVPVELSEQAPPVRHPVPELADVVGQREAVDAVVTAAAGGHHMMLSGPPGAGKTMLASRLPGILPDLTTEEALEVASIRSLSGKSVTGIDSTPPLESPHHSSSVAALVGGGSRGARPGAIVRAHRGVLFIDEAAEFSGVALDALRQPLESGVIEIQRAGFIAHFPTRFQLILATNPCPCGNYGVRGGDCICPPSAIRRYAARLSGPLRDRIDIEMHVSRVASADSEESPTVTTAHAKERVVVARKTALARWKGTSWTRNAAVPGIALRRGKFRLPSSTRWPLDRALERGLITLRGYDRALRLAWTLADLQGHALPDADDVGRALFLRKGMLA